MFNDKCGIGLPLGSDGFCIAAGGCGFAVCVKAASGANAASIATITGAAKASIGLAQCRS